MSDPVENILGRLDGVKETATGWQSLCPAHEDHNPSLSITRGDDGRVLLKCFTGCTVADICRELGIEEKDLFGTDNEPPKRRAAKPPRPPKTVASVDAFVATQNGQTEVYFYNGADGDTVMAVVRTDRGNEKTFTVMHPADGVWVLKAPDGLRPLFCLTNIGCARPVYVLEGEKCVGVAQEIGLVHSVTSSGGSSSPHRTDWRPLADHDVIILPDHDKAGMKYAKDVARILLALDPPARVKILELPGLNDGEDLVQYVTVERIEFADDIICAHIEELAAAAPHWNPNTGKEYHWTEGGNSERLDDNAIQIVAVGGPHLVSDGGIKRRIALRVNGEDKDVVTLRLDSDRERARQAKRWAELLNVDQSILGDKLRVANLAAVAEVQARKGKKVSGGSESPPTPPHRLDQARPVFTKWLKDTDPVLLDVVFGAVMAHRIDGDPVWLFVIGAPGDGKTELLRSMSDHSDIFTVSSLTPNALISGYITDGDDPSLLPKLDGKILIIKDFTAVLTMREESRTEILGTLRDAYDGEACRAFGTGETRRYKSRFGLLAAVTPVIDRYWNVSAQLGERFLRLRIEGKGRESKVRRALKNTNEEAAMRRELSAAALGVLAQPFTLPTVPGSIEESMIHLADFVSRSRSEVSRDRKGVVQYIPAPEVGTRCGKAIKKLAMGIAVARGVSTVDDDVYAILQRVALDTIPSMRGRLLKVLWDVRADHEPTGEIADLAEIPTDTCNTWLSDLRLLGVVDREGVGRFRWRLRWTFQETISGAGLWAAIPCRGVPPYSAPPQTPDSSQTSSDPGLEPVSMEAEPVSRGAESPPSPLCHDADSADYQAWLERGGKGVEVDP